MTLRTRLALAVIVVVLALGVSGVAVLRLVRASLLDSVDRQLAQAAVIVAANQLRPREAGTPPPPATGSNVAGPFPAEGPSGGSSPQLTELFVGTLDARGMLTATITPDLASNVQPAIARASATNHASTATNPHPFNATSRDGAHHFRVIAVPQGTGGDFTVIALPTDRVESTYRQVQIGIAATGALVLLALLLVGWWVERLGLRPIREVTDAADAIAAGDLDRRVDAGSPHTEAGRLGEAFNTMIEERQRSEQELHRFVADASHELRTPLSTISGVLELHRQGALPDGPLLDDGLRRAHQEARRMAGLVEDLLELADLDGGIPLTCADVDVGQIVADAAFDASVTSPQRTIARSVSGPGVAWGDEARLRQVVANLVSNAVAYTPEDGHISLRVVSGPAECRLEVQDDGPGMTAEQARHVFDRFYRVDSGRSRNQGGAGLGLSIVNAIVTAHRGSISLRTAPGAGATFVVRLPVR